MIRILAHRGEMPIARVASAGTPVRKMSEPILHQAKPEDLDALACELSRMGGSSSESGSASPPPPAPPPRDTSKGNCSIMVDVRHSFFIIRDTSGFSNKYPPWSQ